MIIEIASAIIAVGSAISSYIAYKDAKLSETRARNEAQEACQYAHRATSSSDRAKACADQTARDLHLAEGCVASTKGDSMVCMGFMNDTLSVSAKHREAAEKLKTATEVARDAALAHAITASRFFEETAAQRRITEGQAEAAAGHRAAAEAHATTAADHRAAALNHAIDAALHANRSAEHADRSTAHADSVGALSSSIANVASKSGVRLATRTDYTNDGGNVGGR